MGTRWACRRRKVRHGNDCPDGRGLPDPGSARTSDARRRPSTVPQARRRQPGLCRQVIPGFADFRRGGADVRPPPARSGQFGRESVVDDREGHRHRVPRASLRAAQARAGQGTAGTGVAATRQPARPAPTAVGVPPHRGPCRRPVRHLLENPPLPGRRRRTGAADPRVAKHRPEDARHPADVGPEGGRGRGGKSQRGQSQRH